MDEFDFGFCSPNNMLGKEKLAYYIRLYLNKMIGFLSNTTLVDSVELSIETAILIGIIRRFCILESFGNCRRMTAALADSNSTMGFHKVPLSLKEKRKLSQM